MAGFVLLTDADMDAAYKTVRKVAKKLDFKTIEVDEDELGLMKGSLAASIFLGAFIAYCDFQVIFKKKRDSVEIRIHRNSPWWTGVIGVNRVKNQALALTDAVEKSLLDQGADVIERTTF